MVNVDQVRGIPCRMPRGMTHEINRTQSRFRSSRYNQPHEQRPLDLATFVAVIQPLAVECGDRAGRLRRLLFLSAMPSAELCSSQAWRSCRRIPARNLQT